MIFANKPFVLANRLIHNKYLSLCREITHLSVSKSLQTSLIYVVKDDNGRYDYRAQNTQLQYDQIRILYCQPRCETVTTIPACDQKGIPNLSARDVTTMTFRSFAYSHVVNTPEKYYCLLERRYTLLYLNLLLLTL